MRLQNRSCIAGLWVVCFVGWFMFFLGTAIPKGYAHSVGQVQTTKYFAPETVQLLKSRAQAGHPGFQVGDIVNYIIQFTPIANGATTGVAGYITDYIPPGTEVVGAWIVAKDNAGNFYPIPPSLPGGIGNRRAQNIYLAPFNTPAYDPTGLCAAAGFTNNCNGRMEELYADTGIFFSTDPRTAQFPSLPTRIQQGTNGYYINPTGAGGLNTLLGQVNATTHNQWDADQTNAFGTKVLPALTPRSSQTPLVLKLNGTPSGQGAAPFFAGSPVAGPETGYQLDNTGSVGPWRRIAYPGSRMGNAAAGPATVFGVACPTCVGGFSTSAGWNLSLSNPLPPGTNAVRWAVGKIVVGEIRYVKISLRLTAPVPPGGLINGSEVFGGDAGDAGNGQDNPWRYHVPSVADNNSELFVLKELMGACVGAGCIPAPVSSPYVPANAKLRYRITYLNAGNTIQNNVTLSDMLPCQAGAAPVSYNNVPNTVNVISGPIPAPAPATLAAIPAGTNGINCAAGSRQTFSFPTIPTVGPGEGGAIEFDVQTVAGNNSNVPNTAILTSTQVNPGVNSVAMAYVRNAPNLTVTKTTNTPTVTAGGTVSYTITVTNTGTAAATNIVVYDELPTTGGINNPATRFSYAATTSITGMTPVVPVVSVPPTLAPYSAAPGAANQQEVSWNFGVQTLAPGASFTIAFTATVGANVPAQATPYGNAVAVTYQNVAGGPVTRAEVPNTAGVTVTSTLSVTKSIDCVYNGALCIPYNGQIPVNGRVRYRVDYANTGGPVTNAVLSDTLPCQTPANPVSNITIMSGPIGLPTPNPPVIPAGNCATATRQTFSFPPTNLNGGQGGTILFDVQTNASEGNLVVNTATLGAPGANSVTSDVQTIARSAPHLTITKSSSVTGIKPGQTLSYTLTVTNMGTTDATNIVVYDWLPSGSTVANPATRFSFVPGSSLFGGSIVGVVPGVNIPPVAVLTGTVAVTTGSPTVTGTGTSFTTEVAPNDIILINGVAYQVASVANNTSLTLASVYAGASATGVMVTKPYNTSPGGTTYATNQEEVVWKFGAQVLPPGASFTITFTVTVGASIPPNLYSNYSRVYYSSTVSPAVYQANSQAAAVNVSNFIADVTVVKSNGATTVPALGSTTYLLTITNNGPDPADNTVVIDPASPGLSKTAVSCTATGGATCPAGLTVAALEGAGVTIPVFPSGGQVVFTITANVTATSGSVTNSAYKNSPAGVTDGNWNNDQASDSDTVENAPSLVIVKSVNVYSDPQHGLTSPVSIPGAILEYTVVVTNTGLGTAHNVFVTDPIPAHTEFYVNDIGGPGSGPVIFIDGAIASGLTYSFGGLGNGTDNALFSNDGGATYTYTPVPDPNGCDPNVTHLRVTLNGVMNASNGTNNPSFTLKFRVRIK